MDKYSNYWEEGLNPDVEYSYYDALREVFKPEFKNLTNEEIDAYLDDLFEGMTEEEIEGWWKSIKKGLRKILPGAAKIAGGVVGTYLGGPAGTAIGAKIGGTLGRLGSKALHTRRGRHHNRSGKNYSAISTLRKLLQDPTLQKLLYQALRMPESETVEALNEYLDELANLVSETTDELEMIQVDTDQLYTNDALYAKFDNYNDYDTAREDRFDAMTEWLMDAGLMKS